MGALCFLVVSALQICFAPFGDPVPGVGASWVFNARYCDLCFASQVQKRLPRKLERCLPCQDWWTLFPYLPQPSTRAPLYSSQQIRDFTREYFALHTSQERTACVDRQRTRTFAITKRQCVNIRQRASQWEGFVRRITRLP
ncbi:hypothetical protein B0H13DRAFT_1969984 [Mycena leptocephala]|nr:hypothetical protein B0H13DRAFT_1969984 [Mycena leptocephala]